MIKRAMCASVLLMLFSSVSFGSEFRVHEAPGRVEVLEGDKLVTAFHYADKWDKPFLYPLKTPSGLVISRGYPIETVPGESNDHVWHRGIWFGAEMEGGDFWREKARTETGRIVVRGTPKARSNGNSASVSAVADFVAPSGKALGSMVQEFTVRRSGPSYLLDAVITLRADQGAPLTIKGTEECCFAFRLADEFRQDRGATLLNSNGLVGTEKIWGKPAKWTDYSSTKHGKVAGLAVFDHPTNPRHPTRWHARGYGMNAANAVGIADFTKDKSRDGSLTIPQGETVSFRYRVVLHDGDAKQVKVADLYEQYAKQQTNAR